MRIIILHDENSNAKHEINISKKINIQNIKDKFDFIIRGNRKFSKPYYKLIYQNIILNDKRPIKFYNLSDKDEIWIGKLENYIKKDDVIVEIFLVGINSSSMWIILNRNDSIQSVLRILESIQLKIIKIWNANGDEIVMMNETIDKIGNNPHKKLIISYDDNLNCGNEFIFTYCEKIHDKYWNDQILSDFCGYNSGATHINDLKKIMKERKSVIMNDSFFPGLDQILHFPRAFMNSGLLFCRDIADRIRDVLQTKLKFKDGIDEVDNLFWKYFDDALISSLYNFIESSRNQSIDEDESIFTIIWRFLLNLFTNQYKTNITLRTIVVESLNILIDDCNYSICSWINHILITKTEKPEMGIAFAKQSDDVPVMVRMSKLDFQPYISVNSYNIDDAKKAIGWRIGLPEDHLTYIRPGRNYDPENKELDKKSDSFFEVLHDLDDNFTRNLIGKGSFSEVYLCENKQTKQQFVVKKPIKGYEQIYQDISIQNKFLSTQHLKKYSKLYLFEKNRICIGMEYMSKGSLSKYLKSIENLSQQEILKIVYQILIQIEELHKIGIIHCDIKCTNVVIDNNGNAVIIDFGLSKCVSNTSTMLPVEGTYRYLAPEMFKKEPYSFGVDIWAFGMLMVEIVTKEIPFPGIIDCQCVMKIKNLKEYDFQPVYTISKDFLLFIKSCLNISSKERPTAKKLLTSKSIIDYLNNKELK